MSEPIDMVAPPVQALGALEAPARGVPTAFAALPPAEQEELRALAGRIERDRHWVYMGRPRSLRAATVAAIRGLYRLESGVQAVGRRSGSRRARQVLQQVSRRVRGSARATAVAYERLGHAITSISRPALSPRSAAAVRAGTSMGDDVLEVVDGMPVLRGAQPFGTGASGCVVASLLGFDFIHSADRMVFLEANLNPSLRRARAEIYEGDDPLWANLLVFCEQQGLRRVVVYGYRPFSPSHRVSLQRQAAARGVAVRIVDDVLAAGPEVSERAYFMEDAGADTLVVRAKYFRTAWDAVITNKRLTQALMTWYNAIAAPAERVPVPRLLDAAGIHASYEATSVFPNVVCKEATADRGHGIRFFKGPRLPDLDAHGDVVVQEFVTPDTGDARWVRGEKELMTVAGARHPRIFRAHALVTSRGPVYLSAHSVTSMRTVPTQPLADGFAPDAAQFMANFSAGARYGQVPPEEEAWCRDAGLRAAIAFERWARTKYAMESKQ